MKSIARFLLFALSLGLLLGVSFALSGEGPSRTTLASPQACTAGPHGGTIGADEKWCLADSPHLINADATIAPGTTVTIEPGVTVKAANNVTLYVEGTLLAAGTEAQPITFTSDVDTGTYQWAGIAFDGGTGNLTHATVRYAGDRNDLSDALLGAYYRCALTADNAGLTLDHVTVRDVAGDNYEFGLVANNSQLSLAEALFTAIGGTDTANDRPIVLMGGQTTLAASNTVLSGNINNRILLHPGAMMGYADPVLPAGVEMDGYEYRDDFTVPATVTLTIEPGVTVLSGIGGWNVPHDLVVEGRLVALGTETQPITFTSVADSGTYQWTGLSFDGDGGGPAEGQLAHVTIRYAGRRNRVSDALLGSTHRSALTTRKANLMLDHVTVRDVGGDGAEYGLLAGDSQITLADTLFTGIGGGPYAAWDVPIGLLGGQTRLVTSNTVLTGNANDRILLYPGAMMGYANPVLPAGVQMDGYEVREHFTVPVSVTLTIEPGVTVRSGPPLAGAMYAVPDMVVEGRLVALGTATQPITFTSVADSGPYQWTGLSFDGGTGTLRHAIVRYAGRQCYACPSYTGAAIQARNVQAGEVTIEASQVISTSGTNYDRGLYAVNSRVAVTDTLFSGIGDADTNDAAIALSGGSSLALRGSAVEKTAGHGVVVIDGAAQVQIADSSIVENAGHGAWVSGDAAALSMSGTTVLGNSGDGVRNSGNAGVTLGGAAGLGNTILGNSGKGANQIGASVQMTATHNWWGDVTGPYHPALNPGGKGEDVSDRVVFDPWAANWQGDAPTEVLVTLAGPRVVNPGGKADYVAAYYNGRGEMVQDAALIVVLPAMASFWNVTHAGQYMAQRHIAVWKLGDLAPGESGTAAVQVAFAWGLPVGAENAVQARLGGTNLPLGLSNSGNVQTYLDFRPAKLLNSVALSDAELATERQTYPGLDLLYTRAVADGFLPGGAVRLEIDTTEPITQVLLLRPAGEVTYLRRQGDQVLSSTFGQADYAVHDADGGLAFDLQSSAETYWDSWGNGDSPSATGLAYSNCRYENLSRLVLEDKSTGLQQILSSATCYPCLSGGSCDKCFAALQNAAPLPEAVSALACAGDIGAAAASQPAPALASSSPQVSRPHEIQSDPNDTYYECYRSWSEWWDEKPWHYTMVAAPFGIIDRSTNVISGDCEPGQVCVTGLASDGGGCKCPEAKASAAVEPVTQDAVDMLSSCASGEEEGTSVCTPTKIVRPRDPNAKYGLEGDLTPGQLVTYTVTYENEGAGRAYGVYIVDQLDPALDLSTVTVHGPGELITENRTILWTVGELGPKGDIDSQGVVSFTVRLLDGLPAGTPVVNQATVFFPTVGEVTPTNPVVNVVHPLVAVPQRVETAYGQPVAITLAGRGPTGVPLSYQAVAEPLNGMLSGTAPDLLYTPAENATGLDSFTFKVSGGGQESRPAEVQIVIDPAGDAEPPQVWRTYPADGVTDVAVSVDAMITDDVGPIFPPLPFVQFSEALDQETVTNAVVQVVDGNGQALPVTASYNGLLHRVMIQPRQALHGKTVYTVTVAAGLKDLAGNTLSAPYTWSFETGKDPSHQTSLPLIRR